MSRQLTYEIIADGGTDRVLVPIIQWAVHRLDPTVEILEPLFRTRADPVREFLANHDPGGAMLTFVHRDSESGTLDQRLKEFDSVQQPGLIPIVPVRMSEAWIIFDGQAIARAADRPSATVTVPRLAEIEQLADPKARLEQLLLEAAGSPTGRRRKTFQRSLVERRVNVASLIKDYSPLENLAAFSQFQQTLSERYPYQ